MLSYLAKEAGFKTVIYNDIYQTSVSDVKVITLQLGIEIDYFIAGDANEFVSEVHNLNLSPNLICSFDVLEHIYDWESWIETIIKINNPFSLLFMTSANGSNPFIKRKLKKLQKQAEYIGFKKNDSWKDIDLNTAYFTERQKIISAAFPSLNEANTKLLTFKSRGLIKPAIEKLATDFIETGAIRYAINHPTNTCDPYTGNWTEHLINTKEFKVFAGRKNLCIDITNAENGYSENLLRNLIKFSMNIFIKLSGKHNLWLSPVYVLELTKKFQ